MVQPHNLHKEISWPLGAGISFIQSLLLEHDYDWIKSFSNQKSWFVLPGKFRVYGRCFKISAPAHNGQKVYIWHANNAGVHCIFSYKGPLLPFAKYKNSTKPEIWERSSGFQFCCQSGVEEGVLKAARPYLRHKAITASLNKTLIICFLDCEAKISLIFDSLTHAVISVPVLYLIRHVFLWNPHFFFFLLNPRHFNSEMKNVSANFKHRYKTEVYL